MITHLKWVYSKSNTACNVQDFRGWPSSPEDSPSDGQWKLIYPTHYSLVFPEKQKSYMLRAKRSPCQTRANLSPHPNQKIRSLMPWNALCFSLPPATSWMQGFRTCPWISGRVDLGEQVRPSPETGTVTESTTEFITLEKIIIKTASSENHFTYLDWPTDILEHFYPRAHREG